MFGTTLQREGSRTVSPVCCLSTAVKSHERPYEEYAFGRDELEHWPLLSHRDIGRNAIDADVIDHQTTFPFGDVVAEDTGWTTAPVARPDPTIRLISGTTASQPPDSQLRLTFQNPGEQWDPRWFFFRQRS
jgi:hypothetical protein